MPKRAPLPEPAEPGGDAPPPEPIRFYGTSWVDHSGGYAARRLALGTGALLLAALGTVLVSVVAMGLGESAGWLRALVVVALALCTVTAFARTWRGFARPAAEDAVDESAFRSIKVVGFVGVLLAYALRSAVEAPGEALRRADHEAALERLRRRTTKRSGNPARRRSPGGGGRD